VTSSCLETCQCGLPYKKVKEKGKGKRKKEERFGVFLVLNVEHQHIALPEVGCHVWIEVFE